MPYVRDTAEEWAKAGIIQIVQEKPKCVSPLTVSERVDSSGRSKKRLCWDGSRHVNNCLKKQTVTLSALPRALEMTEKDDFQTKYDLKSAFFHIKITESQRTYLGAAYINTEGRKVYFVFNFLPFGLGSAVHAITKMFKPINAYIHSLGIRHSIFVDDGRILARTAEQAEKDRATVYDIIQKAGWILEENKSDGKNQSSQVKEYLGFNIDTRDMTVSLTEEKKAALKKSVEQTIEAITRPVKAKFLAKCAGKMISCEPALGKLPLIAARPIYIEMEPEVEREGWGCTIRTSEEIATSLKYFLENTERFDRTPIRTMENQVSVISIIGKPSEFMKREFLPKHRVFGEAEIWAGDASAYAVCAYTIQANESTYFRGKLNDQEKQLSSGHRELLTVLRMLEFYQKTKGTKLSPTTVYWLTDSENLTTFLTKGSGKRKIQQDIFRVLSLARSLNIEIEPIHLLRDDPRIKIADDGSKIDDSDNWSVDNELFSTLNKEWGFTVDLFADELNAKVQKFYSNFYTPNSTGIDAFAQNWDKEVVWACPPVKDIIKFIRKAKVSKIAGVLIVPAWQTADYWPFIFDADGMLKRDFKSVQKVSPFIISNGKRPNFPMAGYTKFEFLILSIVNN
jgi:hypothetical protein